jgi:hypothetical protein
MTLHTTNSLYHDMRRGRVRFLSCTGDHGDRGKTVCDINYILESDYNFYYGTYYKKEPLAKNPSLKDLRDLFKPERLDQIRLLRKHGIPVIMYMSACCMRTDSLDREFVEKMAQIDLNGKTMPTFGRKNEISACINHPEWVEFQGDYAKILCTEGLADGVFIDNAWIIRSCFCPLCRKKFKHEVAEKVLHKPELDLKEIYEWQKAAGQEAMIPDDALHKGKLTDGLKVTGEKFKWYNEYLRWRVQGYIDYMWQFRKNAEKKTGRKVYFLLNTHAHVGWGLALTAEEGLFETPYFEEGFTFPPFNNIYAIKVGNASHRGKHPSVIITRVGPFGSPTPSQNKVYLAESMAFGGASSPWGLNVHGIKDLEEVNRKYNRFFMLNEEMYAAEKDVSDVAILYSWQSHLYFEMDTFKPTSKALAQLLLDLKIPFDILMCEKGIDLKTLARYKMLVLPELGCVSNELIDLVRKYAAAGGQVVSVGPFGVYDLKFNPRDAFPRFKNLVYFTTDDFQNRFSKKGELGELPESTSVVYMYDPPKGKLPDYFRKEILAKKPLVETNLPGGCFVNLTQGENFVNLHLLNYQVYRLVTAVRWCLDPVKDVEVKIRLSKPVRFARVISPDLNPMEQTIPFTQKKGYVNVTLPVLEHYSIIHLEY